MGGGLGGSIFSAGQAKTAAVEEGKVKTRFDDVAGVDEAKEELVEVVDFLKSPKKYTDIGGKIPKGVLLVGYRNRKNPSCRAVAGSRCSVLEWAQLCRNVCRRGCQPCKRSFKTGAR